MSLFWQLTRPRVPRNAFIIDPDELAAVEIQRSGQRFSLAAAARAGVPEGVLTPSFAGRNIADPEALAGAIEAVAQMAGLGRRQRWSVLLPESAVSTQIIAVESIPGSKQELQQTLTWKVARLVGVQPEDLQVSYHLITTGDTPRMLTVAMRASVLAEYENVFRLLGWTVGLTVPRFVGEASWFEWDSSPGDKLVVASRGTTCMVAIVRKNELLLVRGVDGSPARLSDEIYRLSLYYRDRISTNPDTAAIASVMTLGPVGGESVQAAVGDALGMSPVVVGVVPRFLEGAYPNLQDMSAVLAAAGLATQAWSHA